MTALLEIENLTLHAGDAKLVSDVSFAIHAGERWGLIGESGSGKSLTALATIGLLPRAISSGGTIHLDGQSVLGATERDLIDLRGRAAAFVFQEPLTALDPLMRLGRQVAEPIERRMRREGLKSDPKSVRDEVIALFDRVALPYPDRIARSYPYEISGGQRQRVAIAMALACRPKLLIADEPTTALDVTTQAEILDLLARLVDEFNMALLFISHDLPVVARVAEQIVVMKEGEVVERGPAASVLTVPSHPYTQTLVSAAAAFDDALRGRK
jgi:peptide/nickel transport system ATP-binding protein